jgi:hypothetical protein
MVVVDAEFDKKQVKDFCNENDIKMYILPSGAFNANNIAERAIRTVKNTFEKYIDTFDDIIKKRIEDKIDIKKHSYIVMNSITYFLNRKFNTSVKGIPIELYFDLESPQLPNVNFVKYPSFEVGQHVYVIPRGRQKSLQFQAKKYKGIPGIIIAKPKENTYTVETILKEKKKGEQRNIVINTKWYEFIPISEEQFNKLKKMPLYK